MNILRNILTRTCKEPLVNSIVANAPKNSYLNELCSRMSNIIIQGRLNRSNFKLIFLIQRN